jgi:hypothetical protein
MWVRIEAADRGSWYWTSPRSGHKIVADEDSRHR